MVGCCGGEQPSCLLCGKPLRSSSCCQSQREPMWEYWRDKKGILEAVRKQYPELLKDARINHYVLSAETYLEAIDNYMKEKGL